MSNFHSRWSAPALLMAGLSCNLYAVDGIVLIDQNRALAGGVTPGDAPGFPVTISLPGSYRLSGNLTVPNENTTAIKITAHKVTLDLNGFSINGPTLCSGSPTVCAPVGTGRGVDGGPGQFATVRNGTIVGMGSSGIELTAGHAKVQDVGAFDNGGLGISVNDGIVGASNATRNGDTGIFVANGLVIGSISSNNGKAGINGVISTVVNNSTFANGNAGITATCPSSVFGNTAAFNSPNLSLTGVGCAVANNAAP